MPWAVWIVLAMFGVAATMPGSVAGGMLIIAALVFGALLHQFGLDATHIVEMLWLCAETVLFFWLVIIAGLAISLYGRWQRNEQPAARLNLLILVVGLPFCGLVAVLRATALPDVPP